MPRSIAPGLRITLAAAAFYNYQIDPPWVEAERLREGRRATRGFHGFPKPQAAC
jgi:hypothetical protein